MPSSVRFRALAGPVEMHFVTVLSAICTIIIVNIVNKISLAYVIFLMFIIHWVWFSVEMCFCGAWHNSDGCQSNVKWQPLAGKMARNIFTYILSQSKLFKTGRSPSVLFWKKKKEFTKMHSFNQMVDVFQPSTIFSVDEKGAHTIASN